MSAKGYHVYSPDEPVYRVHAFSRKPEQEQRVDNSACESAAYQADPTAGGVMSAPWRAKYASCMADRGYVVIFADPPKVVNDDAADVRACQNNDPIQLGSCLTAKGYTLIKASNP